MQGIWTARVLEMADLKRNSRTILTFEKLELQRPDEGREFHAAGVAARTIDKESEGEDRR